MDTAARVFGNEAEKLLAPKEEVAVGAQRRARPIRVDDRLEMANGGEQMDHIPKGDGFVVLVAVVVGEHGAGAQASLERLAALAGDFGGGFLQGDLDLGQRRDRDVSKLKLAISLIATNHKDTRSLCLIQKQKQLV